MRGLYKVGFHKRFLSVCIEFLGNVGERVYTEHPLGESRNWFLLGCGGLHQDFSASRLVDGLWPWPVDEGDKG